MSRLYKDVKNGRGTNLTIGSGMYISVGPSGNDVTIRGNGNVLAFDNWNDFVGAIDKEKSVYNSCDYPEGGKIGECIVNYEGTLLELKRQYFRQGWVFKDYHAFHNEPSRPCYVPELDEVIYTKEDFLNMCNGQEEIAERVFEAVDWQHPETYLDEQWMGDKPELAECSCGKWFWCYGVKKCPYCGAEYKGGEE